MSAGRSVSVQPDETGHFKVTLPTRPEWEVARCQHCASEFKDECGEWCVYYRDHPQSGRGVSTHASWDEAYAYAHTRAQHEPTWAVGDEAICVDLGEGRYVYVEIDQAEAWGLKGQRVKVVP